MNAFGYGQQALAWLNGLPRAVTSQGLVPIAIADSYVALGKWKELETCLASERWLDLDHVRFAMLTLAVSKQSGGKRPAPAMAPSQASGAFAPANTRSSRSPGWSESTPTPCVRQPSI